MGASIKNRVGLTVISHYRRRMRLHSITQLTLHGQPLKKRECCNGQNQFLNIINKLTLLQRCLLQATYHEDMPQSTVGEKRVVLPKSAGLSDSGESWLSSLMPRTSNTMLWVGGLYRQSTIFLQDRSPHHQIQKNKSPWRNTKNDIITLTLDQQWNYFVKK